jgi:hypothetical protein
VHACLCGSAGCWQFDELAAAAGDEAAAADDGWCELCVEVGEAMKVHSVIRSKVQCQVL